MYAIQVGTTASNLVSLSREPSEIQYGLNDISSSDAGRTEDANVTMYKMRVGQKRKMTLSWQNLSLAEASEILQAFNPEYIYVRYLDVLEGQWNTRKFYVGDRSAAFFQVRLVNGTTMKSVSFDIIEV